MEINKNDLIPVPMPRHATVSATATYDGISFHGGTRVQYAEHQDGSVTVFQKDTELTMTAELFAQRFKPI